jgi:hypothetical protein
LCPEGMWTCERLGLDNGRHFLMQHISHVCKVKFKECLPFSFRLRFSVVCLGGSNVYILSRGEGSDDKGRSNSFSLREFYCLKLEGVVHLEFLHRIVLSSKMLVQSMGYGKQCLVSFRRQGVTVVMRGFPRRS